MTDEMKLKIAKLEADRYKVDVVTNYNTDKWDAYIKLYAEFSKKCSLFGVTPPAPKHPHSFITIEFKVAKGNL
jgi:hypothetical protein